MAAKKKEAGGSSRYMNENQRDMVLLGLLDVPGQDVKAAVLQCLKTVDLAEFSGDEIGMLVPRRLEAMARVE